MWFNPYRFPSHRRGTSKVIGDFQLKIREINHESETLNQKSQSVARLKVSIV